MAVGLGTIGAIMAYLVVTEGGLALLKHMTGDPEADVQRALESVATESAMQAQAQMTGEIAGQEEIQRKFARFQPLASQALSASALGGSPGALASLRGGREVTRGQDTDLLDLVSTRLGMSPQQLTALTSPRRAGDYTGLAREVGGQVPTQ
jgi:hypothetical protein